jgi:hypothetical protein
VEGLANVFARNGMELHHLPLSRGKVAAFFQDLIGHSDFSQIVQVAAPLEGENGILVHSEVPSLIRSMIRQPFAVAFGIGIAAFYDQAERAKNGVGGFQFVGEFLKAEKGLDPGDEFFGEDGFVEEVVGSSFYAANFIAAIAEPRDENERNQARSRILLHGAAEVIPGLARHHDVGEDQIGCAATDLFLGLIGTGSRDDIVSANGQELAHQAGNTGLIVNHKNERSSTPW